MLRLDEDDYPTDEEEPIGDESNPDPSDDWTDDERDGN